MNLDGDLTDLLLRLVERVEGAYYGKYRGIVTDVGDPDNLGRLRARVPRLLGDTATGWALPCAPYGGASEQGLWAVPDVGAGVWIEFEGGDLAYPIWCGTWWGTDERPEQATPAQKVIKTSAGHKIVFDDDQNSIVITDSNDNTVILDEDGVALADANGNTISLTSDGVTIKSDKISIGDPATDQLVGFDRLNAAMTQFVTAVQNHTHVAPPTGGATGPAVPPPLLTLDSAKSKHGVEI
jgi:uncharacterized protein involved in type VI secretion and phage assembly